MSVTIYHNPRCSKSRETLALLEEKGIHVEHLTAVPGRILTESAGIILARMIERGAADYGRV